MPVAVSVPMDSPDPERHWSTTTLKFGAGQVSYHREIFFPTTASSCSGAQNLDLEDRYVDVGAEVDYVSNGPFHVGLRGGFVYDSADLAVSDPLLDSLSSYVDPTQTSYYVNPFFSLEGKWIGVGLGFLASSEPLQNGDGEDYPGGAEAHASGHFRVGPRSRVYGSVGYGENVPIYSGGGLLNAGIGLRPVSFLDFWGGVAQGPWSSTGLLLRIGVHPKPTWSLDANVRLKTTAQEYGYTVNEYGVGVGFTYRITHE